MALSTLAKETAKYSQVWEIPEYRVACHSLKLWRETPEHFPRRLKSALDIGCGPGRLFDEWNKLGIDAWAIDLVENSLDPDVMERWGHKLILCPLWEMEWDRRFDLGICTDVMEHIPPEFVIETLRRIGACCRKVLFKIAHQAHNYHGFQLHLTIEGPTWWMNQMRAISGSVVQLPDVKRAIHRDSAIWWRP